MNMETNNSYPKLIVNSDNPFFVKQVNRVIFEGSLLVNLVETKNDPIDIMISDQVVSDSELELYPHVILILNQTQTKIANGIPTCNQDKVKIFQYGSLKASELSKYLQNLTYEIIAKNKDSFAMDLVNGWTNSEKQKLEEYEKALTQSEFAQQLIMRPRFEDEDFDIHVIYKAYKNVSGDVLFVQKAYDKIFIMVADVTDHGYLAGMYGSSLYALANDYVLNSSIIEQSAEAWSQYMINAAKMFQPYGLEIGDPLMNLFTANALFCIIDLQKCKIFYSFYGSAQEPPILISHGYNGYHAKLLSEKDGLGSPLGDSNIPAKVYSKKFTRGDALLFYTDGATEIFSDVSGGDEVKKDASRMYSSKKIEKSANEALNHGNKSSKEIVEYILRDAGAYSVSDDLNADANMPNITDDLTLMCIKWEDIKID